MTTGTLDSVRNTVSEFLAVDERYGVDDLRTYEARRNAEREISRALTRGASQTDIINACPVAAHDWLTDVVFA